MDFPELCPLCIKTGDCNHFMAGPQWKNHPDYIIAQEDLPDFDDLTGTNHPHFALIFLASFMKSIPKDKETDLEYERAKVRAKEKSDIILKEMDLIRADSTQINSVTLIPKHDPQDVIVVDEQWFQRRHKTNKGYKEFKF
jgi:PleD family two-component response regulator